MSFLAHIVQLSPSLKEGNIKEHSPAICQRPPEVQETDRGESGEDEASEDHWVRVPAGEFAPPEERHFRYCHCHHHRDRHHNHHRHHHGHSTCMIIVTGQTHR